ncbi:MAG TPA: hypothetical protein EYH44_03040 [Thermoprotei archaeon]|nr:hypothetical protein [Thermoprotei archaeon]
MSNIKIGLAASAIGILIGATLAITSMYWWYIAQNEIVIYLEETISLLILQFYSIQFMSLVLITLGLIFFFKYLIRINWDFGTVM